MNAFDYVNSLAQEVGATVNAYLLTDPTAQTALDASRSIAETVAPLWPAVQAAFMVHDVVGFTLDVTAAPVGLLEVVTDLARSFAEVGDILPSVDQLANMGPDATQAYNDLIDRTADTIRSDLMDESVPPFATSMDDQVEKEADDKRQAEWKETARADQEQREQAQRDADSRVADQLVAALQKDAEQKAEQKKADLPELSQEAQDQRRRDGEEQANLSADHAEQGAKQDKEVARLREQLSERYRDAPDAVKATHLEKFDAAAAAVKVAREDRQATEMRELVERQSRIQASPTQEDPTRY